MRGFTSISETYKNDPQGLTALMNRFLTPLTNAILDRKGTIDKYMGDAIMAFWNAPLDDKEHQLNACEAALDMLERVDELNQEREQEAQGRAARRSFRSISASASTPARCVVGNMGSDQRFDYSVFGDSVNLASRLEGQCKEYGFPIIVGSQDRAGGQGQVRDPRTRLHHGEGQEGAGGDLRHRRPRGRRAVRPLPALRNLTIEMLSCYRSRDWDGALAAIERGSQPTRRTASDALQHLFGAKSQLPDHAAADDWDGAYALDTK